MKEWKSAIVNDIVERNRNDRFVQLRDVASDHGLNHISVGDCRDILNAVLKAAPHLKAVQLLTPEQMQRPATAGLFSTLVFTDHDTELD